MHNLQYISMRLLRRACPAWLSYRLLSHDFTDPDKMAANIPVYRDLLHDQDIELKDKIIAEIGPGTYNPLSLALLNHGAGKIILIEPFIRKIDFFKLKDRIKVFWNEYEKHHPIRMPWADLFVDNGYNSDYVEVQDAYADKTPNPPESADLILSQSVLEHIPDIHALFKEQYRILRPGGNILHIIDLRDHYFKFPFEMLTFSKSTWENVLTSNKKGSGYQNRLRADDYIALLKREGFQSVEFKVLEEDRTGYARVKPRLHRDFSGKEDSILSITKIALFACKIS